MSSSGARLGHFVVLNFMSMVSTKWLFFSNVMALVDGNRQFRPFVFSKLTALAAEGQFVVGQES
jgi:hypothetical protein